MQSSQRKLAIIERGQAQAIRYAQQVYYADHSFGGLGGPAQKAWQAFRSQFAPLGVAAMLPVLMAFQIELRRLIEAGKESRC